MAIVEQNTLCDEMKTRSETNMGPREQLLNRKLEEMKVIRQAYHDNVFVGNHCKLVLKNHEALCSVIKDVPHLHQKFVSIFSLFNRNLSLLVLIEQETCT